MGNSFIFDDEETEQPQPIDSETEPGGEAPPPEEGNNRTFLLAIGGLGAIVFLALLCLAAYAGFILPRQRAAQQAQDAEQLVQNTAIAAAATGTALANAPSYTIQLGDTLADLAERFGIALEALQNANPGIPDSPNPGTVIIIPLPANAPPTYTIQTGDTLADLAARFGVALDALRNANPGLPDSPNPGTIIVVPLPAGGNNYTVQPGDTVLGIAARFGITVEALRNANPDLGDALTPGMILKLPAVVGLLPPEQPSATATPVVAVATSTPILVSTVNPITATVAAAYTQAALAQLTVIPTSTALGAVPSTGFADEVGLPMLLVLGVAFLAVIFFVRRVRTARQS